MSNSIEKPTWKSVPFTSYDAGWVILCIGVAIGGAMIFMPVQISMKGLWVFLTAVIIAYPGVYWFQNLYLETLSKTKDADDYTNIISQYLGKNWGIILSVCYSLLMLTGMLGYSTGLARDSASYLQQYGLTTTLLSDTVWWSLLLMAVMVAIAAQGERLLFKISGPLVIGKVGIIILLAAIMIPYWSFSNIKPTSSVLAFVRDVLITIPFTIHSLAFFPILSPMNVAYRKEESNTEIATYRALRVSRISFAILVISVLFFAVSFTFALPYEKAYEAFKNNISALAIAAQVLPDNATKSLSTALNMFALITAFFAMYLSLQEGLQGITFNILSRFIPEDKINRTILHYGVALAIIVGLWGWVQLNVKTIIIIHLNAPLFAIVACFLPAYLVFAVTNLKYLKGAKIYYIILFGIIMTISPFFRFLE